MLVVLEGLDGAGKSTQVRMFKDYLQKRNGDLSISISPVMMLLCTGNS